ncbi:MAG: PP2C family serine/threonine-protein phosphatase [Sandaracinaceae bacterium]
MTSVVLEAGPADMTFPTLAPGAPTRVDAIDVAGHTDRGRVRERNEDHFLIAELGGYVRVKGTNLADPRRRNEIRSPAATVAAIADGMGGHGHGELASAVALDALAGDLLRFSPQLMDDAGARAPQALLSRLAATAATAQEQLRATTRRKGADATRPGTTLTVALFNRDRALVMHVGDSRAYLARGSAIERLTHDHTLGEQVRAQGLEGAPRLDDILVNVIGGNDDTPAAEVAEVALQPGDALILVSDGVTKYLSDEACVGLIQGRDAATAAEALVAAAVAAGGGDNATAIVARL